MKEETQRLLSKAYEAFNQRQLELALSMMHPDVEWPNGWEGGWVYGREGVSDYWTRQWKEFNAQVHPLAFQETGNGQVEILVAQTVKDFEGNLLFERKVRHSYTIENGLIRKMEILK
jgi:hypothetical protein